MSTSDLEVCAQRTADAESPNERPPNLARQTSTVEFVFREFDQAIVNHLGLSDLVYVGLRIKSLSAAARDRITKLWPLLNPLLSAPFNLTRRDLLQQTHLDLGDRGLGALGAQTLAAAMAIGALSQCIFLRLDENKIGGAGIIALASACVSGALPQCRVLSLFQNRIGDAGITALAQAITPVSEGGSGALPQCTHLELGRNRIGDAGITALAQAIKPVSEGGSGAMASLKKIAVDNKHKRHPGLVAACQPRGIEIE